MTDPPQPDGSHLPHGSVTAELNRLRAENAELRKRLEDAMRIGEELGAEAKKAIAMLGAK